MIEFRHNLRELLRKLSSVLDLNVAVGACRRVQKHQVVSA